MVSYRDILIQELAGQFVVTAVDSCGGIGLNKNDSLQCDPAIAACQTVKVPLMEVMAAGANPFALTLAICNNDTTGQVILDAAKQYCTCLKNPPDIIISTEKNMATSMTAIGVTVVGSCEKENLRIHRLSKGDWIFCAGLPLVGQEVLEQRESVFDLLHMERLLNENQIGLILPVGSKGIRWELENMLHHITLESPLTDKLQIQYERVQFSMAKSAGPSTCCLFSSHETNPPEMDIPVHCIGQVS